LTHPRYLKLCFFSFSLAQLISIFGDRLHQFSVVGMIGKVAPGSSLELFQFALFSHLPILVFAPLFGSIIDRSNKVTVLIVVDIVRGFIVLAVPALFHLSGSLYAFYVPVLFLTLANLLFSPAKSAVVPELFGPLRLLRINAVLWGLGIVGALAGFVTGGWLFDFHTWEMSFYSDAVSYLVSVVFLLPLIALWRGTERPPVEVHPRPERGRWYSGVAMIGGSVREGLVHIRNNRQVAYCLITQTALFACLGALYVVGVARVQSVFPSDKTIYLSAVASAGTVGLLAGAALATLLRRRFSSNRVIAHATLLFAVTCIGAAAARGLVALMSWTFVMGLALSPIFVITETLLQTHAPRSYRGRVFSSREVVTKTAFLAFSMVAAVLGALLGKASIMVFLGVILAGTGVVLERKDFLKV
jgi:MFS family permease